MRPILNNPKFTGSMVLVAVIALGWNTRNELFPKSGRPKKTPDPVASSAALPDQAAKNAPDKLLPPGKPMNRTLIRTLYTRWLTTSDHNPFAVSPPKLVTPDQSSPTNPLPVLSMVSRGRTKTVVVLNGRIFTQGQDIMGYHIERIEDSSVILRDPKNVLHRVSLRWARPLPSPR